MDIIVNLFVYSHILSIFCIPTLLYCKYKLDQDDRIFWIRQRHYEVLDISRYMDCMPIEEVPASVVVDIPNLQENTSS